MSEVRVKGYDDGDELVPKQSTIRSFEYTTNDRQQDEAKVKEVSKTTEGSN